MKFQKRKDNVWRNNYFKINDNDRKKKAKNITLVDSYLRI